MTASEFKPYVLKNGTIDADSAKTTSEKSIATLNLNDLLSTLARLDTDAKANGFGGLTINSGYRSSSKLAELWKKSNGGKNFACAKPGCSAHEWGGAADIINKSGNRGDFFIFVARWIAKSGINFDLLIDESGSSTNHNGWMHLGLSKKDGKSSNRKLYMISWGGTNHGYTTDVNTYISNRNKLTGGSTTGASYSYSNAGSDGSSTYVDVWNGKIPGYDEGSLKAMTAEEIAATAASNELEDEEAYNEALAAMQLAMNSMYRNSDTYEEYTEDEIMQDEAMYEVEDGEFSEMESASPLASQEVKVGDSSTSVASNAILNTNGDSNVSDLSVNSSLNSSIYHTRIYEKVKATIKMDEMSLTLEGQSDIIDASTGIHNNDIPNLNGVATNSNGTMVGTDITKTIGNIAPLIRIEDAYYSLRDIVKFQLSTEDFIPTIYLELNTTNKNILKENSIKEGTICSVFILLANDALRSYRGDFRITASFVDDLKSNDLSMNTKITLFGELHIPTLYDNTNTFSYSGTSMDAVEDTAKKLGLGFFICDGENTNDILMWHCPSKSTSSKLRNSPIISYIKNTTKHAYKNENAFYNSWIDPRYAITFLNMNKLLGEDGLDEKVDIAFYNNAQSNATSITANKLDELAKDKKDKIVPRILTNLTSDGMALTEFYVTSYKEIVNTGITDLLGLYRKLSFSINNAGVNKDDKKVDFKASLCVNKTKLNHGFFILGGPGLNTTYEQADNGDYAELHTISSGGGMSHMQSDGDGEAMKTSGSNMQSSGNTHKFYEVALQHNMLNNKWLKKKLLLVVLNGKNMLIMRGEKIPVLLTKGRVPQADPVAIYSKTPKVLSNLNEVDSGWYIIDGITWTYDNKRIDGGTFWTTTVTLARREWPTPSWTENNSDKNEAEITITNNIKDSTSVESKSDIVDTSTNIDTSTGTNDINTEGLTSTLSSMWTLLNDTAKTSNISLKLVGARRWAADADGNRAEGEPTICDNGSYKFVNSAGDVLWFSEKTSEHLYGNAIDIINNTGTTYALVILLILDTKILAYMFDNTLYGANEVAKDDTGNTVKHFHIGKPESNSISNGLNWWTFVMKSLSKNTFTYNGTTYNINDLILKYNNMEDEAEYAELINNINLILNN